MGVVNKARTAKGVELAQEIALAKDRKRHVTLYLDREVFAAFQKEFGRKTSQAVEEFMKAALADKDVG
jgi:hypothetical protein